MVYSPKEPANLNDVDALREWARDELRQIAQEFSEQTSVELRVTHSEPIRPRNGMIVCADGTDWDPLTSGPGQYPVIYLDGAWVEILT